MRTLGQAAMVVGVAAAVFTVAAAPANAGPVPVGIAALKAATPSDIVRAGWRHGLGPPLPVTLFRGVPYCRYYPCPLFQPAFIPYTYYGAPYYFGSYDGRLFGYHYHRAFHW